ncbi:unnamed protein product [Leptosia nina]|uniref:Uncharacterized protein n=1 Tax=Leptosia nina TaxID=320188 RepID=A0AAV1K0J7_9NEOP
MVWWGVSYEGATEPYFCEKARLSARSKAGLKQSRLETNVSGFIQAKDCRRLPTRPPFGDFTVAVAHCVAAAMVGGGQRVRGLTVAAGYCETMQTAGPRLGGISAAKNQY